MRVEIDRVDAVLFDLDGVLVSTDMAVARLWQRAAALVDRQLSTAEIHSEVLGCTPEHTIARLFDANTPSARRLVLDTVRAGEPELAYEPLPGAARLVRALAAAGVPIALVTSASAGRAEAVVNALQSSGCFRTMVTWGDADRGKPDPQPYQIAIERLRVGPAGCLVFEDSLNGVRSAVAAGTTCVGVDGRGNDSPLWNVGASAVVTSLTQIELVGIAKSVASSRQSDESRSQ